MKLRAAGPRSIAAVGRDAAYRARDYIDAKLATNLTLDELERATGQDRWQLSRDFQALFGTSPYRYLVLRRLDKARGLMLAGVPAADVAFACGFADQSHFGRLFKRAVGLTPHSWPRAATAHDHSIQAAVDRAN